MAGIPEWPHKPAPPEPRRVLPERQLLWRGLALAGVAVAALAGVRAARRGPLLVSLPAGAVLALMALLAGWAAAIHLTGGEWFDDHPWV